MLTGVSLNPLKSGSYPEWGNDPDSDPLTGLNPLKSGSYPELLSQIELLKLQLQSQSPKKRVLSRDSSSLKAACCK